MKKWCMKTIAILALAGSLTGCVGYVHGPGVYGSVDVYAPVPVVVAPAPRVYYSPGPAYVPSGSYYSHRHGHTIFYGARGRHH